MEKNLRSRKSNRIRRHMARATPDVIQMQFDGFADDFNVKSREWASRFVRLMKLKHGDDVRVDISLEEDFSAQKNGTIKAVARVVKHYE